MTRRQIGSENDVTFHLTSAYLFFGEERLALKNELVDCGLPGITHLHRQRFLEFLGIECPDSLVRHFSLSHLPFPLAARLHGSTLFRERGEKVTCKINSEDQVQAGCPISANVVS